jgi:transcriptional regulator GlxA family with amidase domain
MPRVVFVLTEQMLSTSITWPMDMLEAANQTARQLDPNLKPFTTTTVSTHPETIRCHSGFSLQAEKTIDQIQSADIIYLPALWRNPRLAIKKQTPLITWLKEQFENGAIINGVGTGCCFMAAAGLLDNKPATTHWYYFDQFQKQYPQVQLKRQHFITQAGNIYCAASVNSQADLTIYFIQRFLNQKIAQHVQRHFSHEVRRAYESVSYFEDDNINHPDEDILQAQLWLKNNLTKEFSMQEVAELFGMSSRNFTRRFKSAIGKTPTAYLQELRIKTAQDLLQSSNLSIGEIADKIGYSDVGYFSKLFRRSLSISPKEYRIMVRAKLFSTKSI